jgi:hypothetical protein
MRNSVKSMHVKTDYLIGLAWFWYRGDTNFGCIAHSGRAGPRAQRPGSLVSSAKRASTLSRARISTASPRWTSTSHGRGREL